MEYRIDMADDHSATITLLSERIDRQNANELKALARSLTERGVTSIDLDMSQVQFIDSIGLGATVAIERRMRNRGAFSLSGVSTRIAEILRLTDVHRIFNIRPANVEAHSAV